MKESHLAYLGLGSNIGDREEYLAGAIELLSEHPDIELEDESSIYETEPWPKHWVENGREVEIERQEWHLNQVVLVHTSLDPRSLLGVILDIEKQLGKSPKAEWGSRRIDIDILLYDDLILKAERLKIPHPFMTDRQFVLVPLLEIAPELKDPRTGRTYSEFLEAIEERHEIRQVG